jgi:uncharacterized protein YndB with AHSA1/START domain
MHRVLRAPAARIYRAFVEPDAVAKWFPPYGYTCTIHEFSNGVGGTFRMSYKHFATGNSQFFSGKYIELIPGERIVYTAKFDDPAMPEITVTASLRQLTCGTELEIIHEGLAAGIPPELCNLGWQDCLAQLARLVEPDIPATGKSE